jgi:hypothetical protein
MLCLSEQCSLEAQMLPWLDSLYKLETMHLLSWAKPGTPKLAQLTPATPTSSPMGAAVFEPMVYSLTLKESLYAFGPPLFALNTLLSCWSAM